MASIVIAVLSIALAWSGSFTTLAAISAVSRFTQTLPTLSGGNRVPEEMGGPSPDLQNPRRHHHPCDRHPYQPVDAVQCQDHAADLGLGGLPGDPAYYFVYASKKKRGLIKEKEE